MNVPFSDAMPSFRAKRAGAVARTRYTSAIAASKAKRSSRFLRKRLGPIRRRLGMRVKSHSFSRYAGTLTLQSVNQQTVSGNGYSFKFNDLLGYSDFTTLFDRYRINLVVIRVQLEGNPDAVYKPNASDATISKTNFYPKLWWATDHDDSDSVTFDDMRQLEGVKCQVLRPNGFIMIKVKPSILNQTYRTATTTGYAPKWGQWIDMANVNVPHYGLKLMLDSNGYDTGAQPFQIRMEPKFYFQCKDAR